MITMALSVAFLLLPLLALSGVLGVAQGRWSETRATRYNPIEYTALASRSNGHEHVDDVGSLISASCRLFALLFLFCSVCVAAPFAGSPGCIVVTYHVLPCARTLPAGFVRTHFDRCHRVFLLISPSVLFPILTQINGCHSCHPAERALGSSGSSASQSEEVVTRAPQRKRKL